MRYLLLMILATVLVCGGCGDDDNDDTGGDSDSDSDTDTDTDSDSDSDTDTDADTGSDSECDDLCEPCSDEPESCCEPYQCIVAPGEDLCMYFDPDLELCPENEPTDLTTCEHPGLDCVFEYTDCYCTCDGWECGD